MPEEQENQGTADPNRQVESTDPEDTSQLDPLGHPVPDEVSAQDLQEGLELEEDPWDIHKQDHPTPDHPTGRLGP